MRFRSPCNLTVPNLRSCRWRMWVGLVVIPESLQESVLAELHREHMGISKMKALARSHVWWSGLDKDLEAMARSCRACLAVKQAPANAPLHPWAWPSQPWQRLQIDFAGPFLDKSFFIVVDAHSNRQKYLRCAELPLPRPLRPSVICLQFMPFLNRLFPTTGPSSPLLISKISLGPMASSTPVHHPASNGEAENQMSDVMLESNSGSRRNSMISMLG